jgi:ribonuclease P protein component
MGRLFAYPSPCCRVSILEPRDTSPELPFPEAVSSTLTILIFGLNFLAKSKLKVKMAERNKNENLQDKQYSQEANSRVSGKDENEGRAESSFCTTTQRKISCERNHPLQGNPKKLNAFPSSCRIRRKKEFELFKNATTVKRNLICLKLVSNVDGPKFGVAVPRHLGNAPTRNKLRRIIKEWCRLNKARIPKGYYLIIVLGIPEKNITRTLWGELDEIFKQIPR